MWSSNDSVCCSRLLLLLEGVGVIALKEDQPKPLPQTMAAPRASPSPPLPHFFPLLFLSIFSRVTKAAQEVGCPKNFTRKGGHLPNMSTVQCSIPPSTLSNNWPFFKRPPPDRSKILACFFSITKSAQGYWTLLMQQATVPLERGGGGLRFGGC
jgi:hypothetical protein